MISISGVKVVNLNSTNTEVVFEKEKLLAQHKESKHSGPR